MDFKCDDVDINIIQPAVNSNTKKSQVRRNIGKISIDHNSIYVLILLYYMFRLIFRAIIRQKDSKEKLPCKIPYQFYNIYVCVEISTYIL